MSLYESATWAPTSLAQPTTRSIGKTNVGLAASIFTRAATLIPLEDCLLFTSAEALKWQLLHLQASKGTSTFQLVFKM